jgi:hypothetical protein
MSWRNWGTTLKISVLAIFIGGIGLSAVNLSTRADAVPLPTPRRPNYAEFAHTTKAHGLECSACHKFPSENWNKVRTGDGAFPDVTEYPRHESCLKCHAQQFFRGARPVICSICHTNPSPRDSSRHPFPNPRELFDRSAKARTHRSDFGIHFPHDKHIEIVSGRGREHREFVRASYRSPAEESCAVCHKTLTPQGKSDDEYVTKPPANLGDGFWLKKGMFKSVPIGHSTCFTCHSADTGIEPAPQTCNACHKPRPADPIADLDAKLATATGIQDRVTLDAWKRRDSSGTYRHEFFAHEELKCAACHNVAAMNTMDAATKRVGISSCATCHATPTADDGGALNYEIDSRAKTPSFQCVKCHITFGRLPVPESHNKAIAAAKSK